MTVNTFKTLVTTATLVTGISITGSVGAMDTKDQIEHRKAVMEGTAGHLTAIFSTLKDPGKFGANYQFHAESLAMLAKISVDTFPVGSDKGKTKASSAIWEKPEEFTKAMDKFVEKTEALATAAKSNDVMALVGAAKEVGGSCKGCHDDFKEE